MEIQALIIWLIIGALAGWLAGMVVKGMGFGLVGNIIVGIVGAVVAGWLLPRIGISSAPPASYGDIINAAIGAIIVLVIVGFIKRA